MSVEYKTSMAAMMNTLTVKLDEAVADEAWRDAMKIVIAMWAILWSLSN